MPSTSENKSNLLVPASMANPVNSRRYKETSKKRWITGCATRIEDCSVCAISEWGQCTANAAKNERSVDEGNSQAATLADMPLTPEIQTGRPNSLCIPLRYVGHLVNSI